MIAIKQRLYIAALSASLLAGGASAYTLFDDSPSLGAGVTGHRRWGTPGSVTYFVNTVVPATISLAEWETAADSSMLQWTNVANCSLTYVDGGQTATAHNVGDGTNVLSWDIVAPFPSGTGVLAFSQPSLFSDGTIGDDDILFNGVNHNWTVTNEAGQFDISNILVHEAGHMSGLQHSPVRASTMFPSAGSVGQGGNNGLSAVTPATDDILGVQDLYGSQTGLGSISGNIDSDGGNGGMFVGVVNTFTGDTTGVFTGMRRNGAVSEANEDWTINRLTPGQYIVFCMGLDDTFGMLPANASSLNPVDSTFEPRFYSSSSSTGTAVPGSASVIVVTPNSSTTSINIDPPDAAPTEIGQNASTDIIGSGNFGPFGARITSASQGIDVVHGSPAVVTSAVSVLGTGSTMSNLSSTGFAFAADTLYAACTNRIYDSTVNSTTSVPGILRTYAVPYSGGTKVEIVPGVLDMQFTLNANPEAEVRDGATEIVDGTGTAVNFGTTTQGNPALTKTFRVNNLGVVNLTTGAPTVSSPYSVTESLSSSIPPGSFDDFTVQLSTATAGTFNSTISFATNDSGENPYNFPITGTINSPSGPPTVSSINRADSNPTLAGARNYTVTFSESVTGVDSGDFSLTATTTGSSLGAVTGSGATRNVVVNTGTGPGNVTLNLVDNDTIIDGSALPLGGAGAGNGNFTGQTYNVDNGIPTATIARDMVSATNQDFGLWSVDFNESVGATFTNADVTPTGTLATGAQVAVGGDDPNFVVIIMLDNANANGTIGFNIGAGVVQDSGGFSYAGGTGAAYTINNALFTHINGDVNKDGVVDIVDVALLSDFNLGIGTLP